jgi:ABC-type nitrate/sulfonate/bicarbonate transport system permease component
VIAEWLGGSSGLGVYMTRVRKSYAFDKMFAIIFFVSGLSILLMRLTALLEKKMTPWARQGERKDS